MLLTAVTEEWISRANLQLIIWPVFTVLNAQQKEWKIVKRKDVIFWYISVEHRKKAEYEASQGNVSATEAALRSQCH